MQKKYFYPLLAAATIVVMMGCGKRNYEEYQIHTLNGKQGYVDKNGIVVIPPRYDNVELFDSKGLARVILNGERGQINSKGEWQNGLEPKVKTPEELEAIAFENMKKNAQNGDSNAQTQMGLYHSDGLKVVIDYVEAAKWYSMAAESGDMIAIYKLARIYLGGEVPGISRSETQGIGVDLLKRAAVQGYAPAQLLYASHLYGGTAYSGLRPNPREAFYWFQEAYKSEDPEIKEAARKNLDFMIRFKSTQ